MNIGLYVPIVSSEFCCSVSVTDSENVDSSEILSEDLNRCGVLISGL